MTQNNTPPASPAADRSHRPRHEQWLKELTSTPTASGHEDLVAQWVRRWAAQRSGVIVEQDAFGNLLLSCERKTETAAPIFLAAHIDHPAFVVAAVHSATSIDAEFRGGVEKKFFVGTKVRLHSRGAAVEGVVESFELNPGKESWGTTDGEKYVRIRLENVGGQAVTPCVGDVVTWALPTAAVDAATGRLSAPACDDLAGAAAAIAAFDLYLGAPAGASDLRLLFTRAEEFGFLGAIAAASSRSIPTNARIVAIENSKSFPESPIGAGPIVRVGDFTSTFDPDLTYRVGRIAQAIGAADKTFKYQRKLMPGGTCEASAYQAYGYVATCVCLPLGNYHNMDEQAGKIDSEVIAIEDFHGLVTLLATIPVMLDDPEKSPMLRTRLDALFASRKMVLDRKLV